ALPIIRDYCGGVLSSPQPLPGDRILPFRADRMPQTHILITEPQTSGVVFGNGVHDQVWHTVNRKKSAILEICHSSSSCDPHSPAPIWKKGRGVVVGKSVVHDFANRRVRERS